MTVTKAVNQRNLGGRVTTRNISWMDLCMRAWGTEWAAPDHNVYEFSSGRRYDSTDRNNTGIYNGGIIPTVYAVLNSADKSAGVTLSNGGLTATSSGNNQGIRANMSVASGKVYWEVTVTTAGAGNNMSTGVAKSTAALNPMGSDTGGEGILASNGSKFYNNGLSGFGSPYGQGDILGFALDADAHSLQVFINGVLQGTMTSVTSGPFYPAWSSLANQAEAVTFNFGATAFKYNPPAGYTPGIFTPGT